jgi:3-oxoacyl-[acyl-carrier-protein] synthase II
MKQRVAITGVGTVNAHLAGDAAALAEWLAAPRGRDAREEATTAARRPLGELVDEAEARRLSRACQLAVAASRLALADAGRPAGDDMGLILGTELGDLGSTREFADGYLDTGLSGLSALLFPNTVMNAMAATATIAVSARALSLTLNAATVAGELAVAHAAAAVASGRAAAMLAGGVDQLEPYVMRTLAALGSEPPEARGEGATVVLLEPRQAAEARGARVLGEVRAAAWGTLPARPHGVGRSTVSAAIAAALGAAGVDPAELGWVYTSASGDQARDTWERALLEAAIGARRVPTAAPRLVFGQHAGVGALAVAAAAWTAGTGVLPPWGQDMPLGVSGPGLVHAVARGGDHVALVVGP